MGGELFDYVANTGAFSESICRYYFKQMLITEQTAQDARDGGWPDRADGRSQCRGIILLKREGRHATHALLVEKDRHKLGAGNGLLGFPKGKVDRRISRLAIGKLL